MSRTEVIPLVHPVNDACRMLSVGRTAFYALVAQGEIRLIKIGSKSLVPDEEIRGVVARRLEAAAE